MIFVKLFRIFGIFAFAAAMVPHDQQHLIQNTNTPVATSSYVFPFATTAATPATTSYVSYDPTMMQQSSSFEQQHSPLVLNPTMLQQNPSMMQQQFLDPQIAQPAAFVDQVQQNIAQAHAQAVAANSMNQQILPPHPSILTPTSFNIIAPLPVGISPTFHSVPRTFASGKSMYNCICLKKICAKYPF